jgi:hypothetical protein
MRFKKNRSRRLAVLFSRKMNLAYDFSLSIIEEPRTHLIVDLVLTGCAETVEGIEEQDGEDAMSNDDRLLSAIESAPESMGWRLLARVDPWK